MINLDEQSISCPYCGEAITVLIDTSLDEQTYIEDCQVCCRPIVLDVSIDRDGLVNVFPRTEND